MDGYINGLYIREHNIIGVEIFIINRGMTKKKPKIQALKDYSILHNLETEDVETICDFIQKDWKQFRTWFLDYNKNVFKNL